MIIMTVLKISIDSYGRSFIVFKDNYGSNGVIFQRYNTKDGGGGLLSNKMWVFNSQVDYRIIPNHGWRCRHWLPWQRSLGLQERYGRAHSGVRLLCVRLYDLGCKSYTSSRPPGCHGFGAHGGVQHTAVVRR